MGAIKAVTIGVTTTGSAGSGAGNADSDTFAGEIQNLYVNHHANAPATTDVVVTDKRTGVEIWRGNNANTDIAVAPRIFGVDKANAALTNNVTPEKYCVDQGVNVAVAGGNFQLGGHRMQQVAEATDCKPHDQ